MLVDQGDADQFLDEQLRTHLLREACAAAGMKATIRMQPGYDHSYYFISTFMDEHVRLARGAYEGLRAGVFPLPG